MTAGGSSGSGAAPMTGGGAGTGGTPSAGGAAATGGSTTSGGSGGTAGGAGSAGGSVSTAGEGGAGVSGGSGNGGAPANEGGMSGAGTAGSNAGGAGAAAGTAGSGGAAMVGRPHSACQPGVSYPAPILTGTPVLVSQDMGASPGTYEGPVWRSATGKLLFSDITTMMMSIPPSQIHELTPPNTVVPLLADAGTNGLALDTAGAVYGCSHKVQGIVRLDGNVPTTVVGTIDGKRFNSPNDLVMRSDGTGYFTDPDYQLGDRTSETGTKGVYRFTPAGVASVVDNTFEQPNGITLSPDETVLYVADYPANVVRRFAVAPDGSTSGRTDFATVMSPDGFAVDCLGNLYVASGTPQDMPTTGGTVEVFSPAGALLGSVTVAPSASNLAFGGPDGKTLYITAGKALYSLSMNVPGYFY
jgi:gluconolactonase